MLDTLDRRAVAPKAKETRLSRSRRPLQARARGALLVGLVLFVVAQISMSAAIENWLPELRDPTFEIKVRQLTDLIGQHRQTPTTVVFLGSSISANGMKAGMVDAPLSAALGRPAIGYNLATNGAGPITHLVKVQRLLRRGVRPDLVVLEMSPIFYAAVESGINIRRLSPHLMEHRDLDTLERHTDSASLRAEWWEANLVPIHGHRLMILNHSARPLVPYADRVSVWNDADAHGWQGRPSLTPQAHGQVLELVETQFKARLGAYKVDDAPLKALRELTDLLAKEGIATLMVVMPEGPLMRSLYAPEAHAALLAEFSRISRKHRFPLIQARAWLGEDQFRDSYHLHEEGAAVFTERLVQEAILPIAANLPASRLTKNASAD